MKRIENARKSFVLQLETVFVDPLDSLARNDLPAAREFKKRWEKSGAEYLHENAKFMARKAKDAGLAENAAEVAALRKEYHEVSLDYVGRMLEVLGKEQVRVSEAVLALFQSRMALCENERTVFEDIGPILLYLEHSAATSRIQMNSNREENCDQRAQILEKSAQLYNPLTLSTNGANLDPTLEDQQPPPSESTSTPSLSIRRSGYLYKRSSHTVRPVWSRRFFSLHDNCLEYYTLEAKNKSSTVTIDLRLCTVKRLELPERRHCFEIVSPVKTYTLQAENEKEMEEWMEAILKSIHEAIQSPAVSTAITKISVAGRESPCQEMLSSYLPEAAIDTALSEEVRSGIRNIEGNMICVDCGAPEPEWASLSLGVLMCIECSGIHRSLGVHRSKVRSLRLDYWEPEHVDILRGTGNSVGHKIFEALYDEQRAASPSSSDDSQHRFYRRPIPESSHTDKEQWIIAKYDLCKFVKPVGDDIVISDAIKMGDLPTCLHWLASGNSVDASLNKDGMRPLHMSISSEQWAISSLFLLWSADVDSVDLEGRTALHYLATIENFSLSLLISLLRKNVNMTIVDMAGRDAMSIAVENGHGDFVTVLRMFQHDQRKRQPTTTTSSSLVPTTPQANAQPASEHGTKRQTIRKLLRHYPKFYRRFTHHPRIRRNSLGSPSSNLSTSMETFDPFTSRNGHRRSHSHASTCSVVNAKGSEALDEDYIDPGDVLHSE
jgi:Arf-GAP/coiled-coil/ANK repeat/PH domain-containing protein